VASTASLLETIALATLPKYELLPRLAMLWRRELTEPKLGYDEKLDRDDILAWVMQKWGPLFPAGKEIRWARLVLDEIRRQERIIARKNKLRAFAPLDPYDLRPEERTLAIRRGRLLDQVLGPPHRWVFSKRLVDGIYFCGTIGLSFVAGLVSTNVKLKDGARHRLLVYREKGKKPRSYWVGSHVISIRQALDWLKKPAVVRAQNAGARVVFDGERRLYRLVYPDGRVTRVHWRKIAEY